MAAATSGASCEDRAALIADLLADISRRTLLPPPLPPPPPPPPPPHSFGPNSIASRRTPNGTCRPCARPAPTPTPGGRVDALAGGQRRALRRLPGAHRVAAPEGLLRGEYGDVAARSDLVRVRLRSGACRSAWPSCTRRWPRASACRWPSRTSRTTCCSALSRFGNGGRGLRPRGGGRKKGGRGKGLQQQ